jgi:hypothetical protein
LIEILGFEQFQPPKRDDEESIKSGKKQDHVIRDFTLNQKG